MGKERKMKNLLENIFCKGNFPLDGRFLEFQSSGILEKFIPGEYINIRIRSRILPIVNFSMTKIIVNLLICFTIEINRSIYF